MVPGLQARRSPQAVALEEMPPRKLEEEKENPENFPNRRQLGQAGGGVRRAWASLWDLIQGARSQLSPGSLGAPGPHSCRLKSQRPPGHTWTQSPLPRLRDRSCVCFRRLSRQLRLAPRAGRSRLSGWAGRATLGANPPPAAQSGAPRAVVVAAGALRRDPRGRRRSDN